MPMDTTQRIRAHFAESAELKLAAVNVLAPLIARAAGLMTECLLGDGKLLACGNGGSAADAQPGSSAAGDPLSVRRHRHESIGRRGLIGQRIARAATTLVLMTSVVVSQSACVPLLVGGAIAGGAAVATDRRSAGAQLDDEVIEDKSSIAIHERFKGDFHVNVTSFNG